MGGVRDPVDAHGGSTSCVRLGELEQPVEAELEKGGDQGGVGAAPVGAILGARHRWLP